MSTGARSIQVQKTMKPLLKWPPVSEKSKKSTISWPCERSLRIPLTQSAWTRGNKWYPRTYPHSHSYTEHQRHTVAQWRQKSGRLIGKSTKVADRVLLVHYQAADTGRIGHSKCPRHEACLLLICTVACGWGTHDMTVIWCMTFITYNNITCHLVELFIWLLALKRIHTTKYMQICRSFILIKWVCLVKQSSRSVGECWWNYMRSFQVITLLISCAIQNKITKPEIRPVDLTAATYLHKIGKFNKLAR